MLPFVTLLDCVELSNGHFGALKLTKENDEISLGPPRLCFIPLQVFSPTDVAYELA